MRCWVKKLVPLVAVAALLYTHLALAAQSCAIPFATPAMALSGEPMAKCGMNSNTCLGQLTQEDRAVNAVGAQPSSPALAVTSAFAWRERVVLTRRANPLLAREPSPPLHILFCRLLN